MRVGPRSARIVTRVIRSVATALVVSFLSLPAAEWALRTWAPLHLSSAQSAYRYDEELGYRLKPGIRPRALGPPRRDLHQ